MQVSLYGKLAQLWKKMWSHKRVKGLETIINALSLFKDNHIQKSKHASEKQICNSHSGASQSLPSNQIYLGISS